MTVRRYISETIVRATPYRLAESVSPSVNANEYGLAFFLRAVYGRVSDELRSRGTARRRKADTGGKSGNLDDFRAPHTDKFMIRRTTG